MDAMNELPPELARALTALDAKAARSAAKVDSTRVAEAVLTRLREPEVQAARPFWQLRTARIAAAILLFAAVGVAIRSNAHRSGMTIVSMDTAQQADSFDAGQVDSVITAVKEDARPTASTAPTGAAVTVDDLNEQELQVLLTSMDSSEGTS